MGFVQKYWWVILVGVMAALFAVTRSQRVMGQGGDVADGCGCKTGLDKPTLERFFGRIRGNYGVGRMADLANLSSWDNNTVLPYTAHPEPGNIGYRYAFTLSGPLPVASDTRGYGGILPLSQQPRLDIPQPFSYRYIG